MSDNIIRRPRGHKVKPIYLYGAGGVVVLGALWWTRHRAAAAPDVTGDPGTDPNAYMDNGYADYGSAGYYADGSSAYGTTPGLYGYYDPSTGSVITPGTNPGTVTTPTTNAGWTQQATAYLVGQGYNPMTVLAALGAYLAGGALTQNQFEIVGAAIAAEGYPPTKPPAPHVAPAPGQPALKPAPRLTQTGHTAKQATLGWTQIQGAEHYRLRHAFTGTVVYDGPGHSATVKRPATGTHYYIVAAFVQNRQISKESNRVGVS